MVNVDGGKGRGGMAGSDLKAGAARRIAADPADARRIDIDPDLSVSIGSDIVKHGSTRHVGIAVHIRIAIYRGSRHGVAGRVEINGGGIEAGRHLGTLNAVDAYPAGL